MGAEGSFLIPGIAPGNYRADIRLFSPPQWLGWTERNITIPLDSGVSMTNPLDLGKIELRSVAAARVGDAAPPFEIWAPDGSALKLAAYRGKFVLLCFWASGFGQQVTVNVGVRNMGTAGAPASTLHLWLSDDTVGGNADDHDCDHELPTQSGAHGVPNRTCGPTFDYQATRRRRDAREPVSGPAAGPPAVGTRWTGPISRSSSAARSSVATAFIAILSFSSLVFAAAQTIPLTAAALSNGWDIKRMAVNDAGAVVFTGGDFQGLADGIVFSAPSSFYRIANLGYVALGVDLLIIGTHGQARLAPASVGGTTERVVRNAPCAVLTVRSSGR